MATHPGRLLRCCCLVISLSLPITAAAEVAVQIEGVEGTMQEGLRSTLSIASLPADAEPSDARVRYLHRNAEDQLRDALQAYSYFNPQIDSRLERTESGWLAIYEVNPGPAVLIEDQKLELLGEGADSGLFDAWLKSPVLASGEKLDQQAYDALKADLLEQAALEGYHDARFTQSKIEVYPEDNRARIELSFDTGPAYTISDINFGEAPVRESLLRRYQTVQAGDPVRNDELILMQRGLIDSDYFELVDVQPDWSQADDQHRVPVEVNMQPNKRTAYRFGVGYGTDTGARLSVRQDRRWVNDRGHSMDTKLELSEVTNTLSSEYGIPGVNPLNDSYAVQALYEQETTDTTDTEKWSLAALDKRLRGNQSWNYGLILEQEKFSFGGEEQSTLLLVPELDWEISKADDRLNTRNGYRLGIKLSGAEENIISDLSFVQIEADAKVVKSLGDDWRFLGRTQIGATAVEDFEHMPSSRRFFAGGDNSVRGYTYKELGPEDGEGNVRGGRYLLTYSAEFDYRVAGNWRAAVFYDAGNAFDSLSTPLKQSAGVGARWQSPIGPIRVDLAKPLDDDGFRIHFSLGPDL
ncbi:autotransporter secretion outer membrane protein TamA [Marinobacterium mangrovicola]|uniref:Translocation and assembly module subunit TamA n=1 Tax=Marinobacterium mangrovicola TaxID=1476959 RepID=A0A4R1GPD2_9GAMM|nr:autotransporter secretion outer membrane protein TamA [Marinobacterium mangrovicola]